MENLKPKSFSSTERFLLVLLLARRVREIETGSLLMVPRDNHKDCVVALREMHEGMLDFDGLYNALMSEFQSADYRVVEEDSELSPDERELEKALSPDLGVDH